MQFAYLKMHGAGNRILVVDERESNRPPPTTEQLRELGDSRTGPGFDQLMWIAPASDATAVASYRVFNADGSEVEQCGNGVRCVAWLVARVDANGDTLVLQGPAGNVEARVLDAGRVSVDMGRPEFRPDRVPFVAKKEAIGYDLDVFGRTLEVSVLSMGNPHCVLSVDDVESAPVVRLGPLIEQHERFPSRTNVGFMVARDRGTIDLRVYERGVGETLACGTGACAAMVAAHRQGLVDDEVTVNLPGGQLVVSWRGDAAPVWLTGNAELISEGTIDL